MSLLAPRIVNEVSYVMRITDDIHLAWQAQYLVKLKGPLVAPRIVNVVSYFTRINDEFHFAWQAQYLAKLECDFFVAGAALRDILGDSRSAKCCIFSRKRPRRVLSKKALSLKTVIKDCHQTSPKILLK